MATARGDARAQDIVHHPVRMATLQKDNAHLRRQIAWFKRLIIGCKPQKRLDIETSGQGDLFGNFERVSKRHGVAGDGINYPCSFHRFKKSASEQTKN